MTERNRPGAPALPPDQKLRPSFRTLTTQPVNDLLSRLAEYRGLNVSNLGRLALWHDLDMFLATHPIGDPVIDSIRKEWNALKHTDRTFKELREQGLL